MRGIALLMSVLKDEMPKDKKEYNPIPDTPDVYEDMNDYYLNDVPEPKNTDLWEMMI